MAMVDLSSSNNKLHVVFLPFFTPSHIIPLVDAARLFAGNGVKVSIITTPCNAALFQKSVDYNIELGQDISILNLKFPSAETGLPEGIENFSAATTMEDAGKVYGGILLLQKPMEKMILDLSPHCIFSDMFYPWTVDLAEELKIPRLLFYPNNFMSHCIPHNLDQYTPYANVKSGSENFLVPGLPDKIEMKFTQLEDYFTKQTPFTDILKNIKNSELRSYAMVHDTVYELEAAYADYYRKLKGKKYYTVGPIFHFSNRDAANSVTVTVTVTSSQNLGSGSNVSCDDDGCLDWLNSQETAKVLFICFGTLAKFPNSQLIDIALALEASGQPFIWAVRIKEKDDVSWLPNGYEERLMKNKNGIIIRGWAPQLKILNHPAIGGFMTHCGWNSLMEAITAGVPVITWPLFAEQFYNEKLIEVMGFGVGVGADVWNPAHVIENLVGREEIEEAIKRLMRDSEESRKIRGKSKHGAAMVKAAVEEGGSSYQNLVDLIEDIKSYVFQNIK